jgi:hypothetical protein
MTRRRDFYRLVRFERGVERPSRRELAGEYLHVRCEVAQNPCDAAAQSPAAPRHDDRFNVGQILEDLQGDRPVPGHDGAIAERMHKDALEPGD